MAIHTIFRTGKLKFDTYFQYASNISNSKFYGAILGSEMKNWKLFSSLHAF